MSLTGHFGLEERRHRFTLAWQRFWFIEMDPFIFGVFRVVLGVYSFIFYYALMPNWLDFFGPSGMYAEALKPWSEYFLFDSTLFYISSEAVCSLFLWLSLLSSLLLIGGFLGKFPLLWLWMSNYSVMFRNLGTSHGEEQVLAILLFFSLFLPLNRTLCFADLFSGKSWKEFLFKEEKVKVWALRLLQIHFVLIYALSTPLKIILEPAWSAGTISYFGLMEMVYPRWPGLAVFAWGKAVVSRILTYGTLALEFSFPYLVWFAPFRLPLVLSMMVMHMGIGFFLAGVAPFNASMVVGLVIFLPSRRSRLFFQKVLIKKS